MNVGELAYVEYAGYAGVVHARLLLSHVTGGDWVILTPDRDVYVETMQADNPDFSLFIHVADGGMPPGIPPGQVYAFGAMTGREYAQFIAAGRAERDAELGRRGMAIPVAAIAAAGPVAARAEAADVEDEEIWVLAEFVEGHKIGETVIPPIGAPTDGDRCLMRINDTQGKEHIVLAGRTRRGDLDSFCDERIRLARESISAHGDDQVAADDVRTLSIQYGANGERSRNFRKSVEEMRQVEFDDFPLSLRTCQSYLKAVAEVGECCYAQHLAWVQQSKIPEGDRAIYEDEVLSKVIDSAIRYDGLNIINLSSFELIVRRKQLLAEAHVANPGAPSYEAADFFMGQKYRPGGGIVVPSLTQQVAQAMHEESQIMKEKRKLLEAKGAGKKGKNPSPPADGAGGSGKK